MTLAQVDALSRHWMLNPPPAMQLRRIALAIGLKDYEPPKRAGDAIKEMMEAGLHVSDSLPDDPMLAFLDLPNGK